MDLHATPSLPEPLSTEPAAAPPSGRIAPLWHTALLIVMVVAVSFMGANASTRSNSGTLRIVQYVATMLWLWLLVGYVYLGVRLGRRTTLRELVGGRWTGAEDFLLDIAIAVGFWVTAAVLLGLAGMLMGLGGEADTRQALRDLTFLIPASGKEFAVWVATSVTAGICEEVIFRGYLQRQFASLTGSAFLGIALSALVFGGGHGYEGGQRMLLIALFGAMFGVLAHLRRSLRPGMMAHAWHNTIVGLILWLIPAEKLLQR